jgi:hypothetical protein
MSDARFPVKMAGRVPVVETPEEIDITNAGQFREALLACTAPLLKSCASSRSPVSTACFPATATSTGPSAG